jgi:hypothetical protein
MVSDDPELHLPILPEPYQAAIKLSFLAPSGYGKTTAAGIVGALFHAVNIRLAAPLYDLQRVIYNFIGKENHDQQDGELLQFLGAKIQREKPHFLALKFFDNVLHANIGQRSSIITNDDCRPHNYPYLKAWGFKFVAIQGVRRSRLDHTHIDPQNEIEWRVDQIPHDLLLCNTGDLAQLRSAVQEMMENHFNVQEVLRHTDTNGM